MVRSPNTSALATSPSTDKCFRRPTCSETIASLRSSLSTWYLLPKPDASRRSSSCMEDSMPSTLRLLTSVCPYSDGQNLEAQSRASESILRLISSRRFLFSTESPMPRYTMSTLWTGSHTSLWRTMCYFDLARLYKINVFGAFFIIREKGKPAYEIVDGESILDGTDNVLKDQTIRFTKKENQEKYPSVIRRIVYYVPELHRSFVYYTNNFYLNAKDIALLYKYRWQVELFLNGLNSISKSSVSGENPKMQSAYRYTWLSSPTASLPSSSTTSRLADPSSKSCASLASLHSPQTTSETFSCLSGRAKRQMTGNSILTSNLINIYY